MTSTPVTDLQVGQCVKVAGHTLRLTARSDQAGPAGTTVANFSTVLVASDPGADPWVIRMSGRPCECGRQCEGWHVQGNHLAHEYVVEPSTYDSAGARLLRSVTSGRESVWSPERGWHDS